MHSAPRPHWQPRQPRPPARALAAIARLRPPARRRRWRRRPIPHCHCSSAPTCPRDSAPMTPEQRRRRRRRRGPCCPAQRVGQEAGRCYPVGRWPMGPAGCYGVSLKRRTAAAVAASRRRWWCGRIVLCGGGGACTIPRSAASTCASDGVERRPRERGERGAPPPAGSAATVRRSPIRGSRNPSSPTGPLLPRSRCCPFPVVAPTLLAVADATKCCFFLAMGVVFRGSTWGLFFFFVSVFFCYCSFSSGLGPLQLLRWRLASNSTMPGRWIKGPVFPPPAQRRKELQEKKTICPRRRRLLFPQPPLRWS